MGVVGLDHVQVAAPRGCEVEARRFYGTLLGLVEIEKPESLRERGGVWFHCGEQQLHVGVEEGFAPAQKAHPAIRVAPGELDVLAVRCEMLVSRWSGMRRWPAFGGSTCRIRGATALSFSQPDQRIATSV
jgi:catechol 2,3-dioxygenase-like lactoylglutathione lyase family enzyme